MAYEIVTTYDGIEVGRPDIKFVSDGPSLTITLNSWSSKFGVCIVYIDTVTGKKYGCAAFFVEPDHSSGDFCTSYPDSCHCDNSCIDNFKDFCENVNFVPGIQPDFISLIDSVNNVTPKEHSIAAWTNG